MADNNSPQSLMHTEGSSELARTDIQELIALAARLRAESGGELDESALQAVAEATGAPLEYVRVAMMSAKDETVQKRTLIGRIKEFTLAFDPAVRSYLISGYLAVGSALFSTVGTLLHDRSGLFGVVALLFVLGAAYSAGMARERRVACLSGAIFGAAHFFFSAAVLAVGQIWAKSVSGHAPTALFAYAAGGFVIGGMAQRFLQRHGVAVATDPASERQRLLTQLVELQDKLRSGEQTMSFLSLDVVGSTRMKEVADPLAVEFTFSEYYRFVEGIAAKYGGSVHSTAGDGMTLAFESPYHAFAAAKNIQGGMPELNTYRNKIGMAMQLRAGIHHGAVVPQGEGIRSINFAHVIDIAAHLQKAAPPNGIAISMPAAMMLPGGADQVGPETIRVQNVDARIWAPRSTAAQDLPAATPPPFKA